MRLIKPGKGKGPGPLSPWNVSPVVKSTCSMCPLTEKKQSRERKETALDRTSNSDTV